MEYASKPEELHRQ